MKNQIEPHYHCPNCEIGILKELTRQPWKVNGGVRFVFICGSCKELYRKYEDRPLDKMERL